MMPRKPIAIPLAAALVCWLAAGLPAAAAEPELRGVWMHGTQIKTPAEVRQCAARIEAANLNATFLLVWYWGGQAYFQSDLCSMAEGVEPGFDPLAAMVDQCHRRGIEVHAWFVNGAYGADRPRHILDKHPDWAVDAGAGGGLWYDFGKPEVRQFESDLMIECLRKYGIDGLHFDYIRYGPRECYCEHCQGEFSRRYGFPPITAEDRDKLPVAGTFSANPLARPTTAEVLAEFSDGTPAVALNEAGEGGTLLLNWHAERQMPPAVAEIVRRVLRRWKMEGSAAVVVDTAPNRQRYGRGSTQDGVEALRRLGSKARAADEAALDGLKPDTLLVLSGVYLVPDETAAKVARFVEGGGRLLVFDGPVFAVRNRAMQRVLGFEAMGKYFTRPEIIRPAGPSDLVPASGRRLSLEEEQRRAEKWAEFRAWGVSELVRDVYRRAKALRPEAQVTAAVFTPLGAARNVYQDWPGWLREGTIDYVIPMAYTTDNEALAAQIAEWKTVDAKLERIVPGLSIYEKSEGGAVPRRIELIRAQHAMCVEAGARGNVYFALNYLDPERVELMHGQFYPQKAPAYRPPARVE